MLGYDTIKNMTWGEVGRLLAIWGFLVAGWVLYIKLSVQHPDAPPPPIPLSEKSPEVEK